MAKRGDWIKFIVGSKHGDDLKGSAGKDVVVGRRGDDSIDGGAGNDILFGDDMSGGTLWGCRFGGWWHARGSGNDYLDGGAGSDRVLAGRGNDVANYTLSQNLGSHDVYDGGKGFDTLQLTLTQSEFHSASVQQDIAAFQKFLDYKANPYSDHGKTFHFKSFDLDARNFEALKINVIDAAPANAAPTARDDAATTGEDTPLVIAAPGVLANDTDPDQHDVLTVTGADAQSTLGVAVVVGADGSIAYDAGGLFEYLAAGESITDSFDYTIADLGGATASATAHVTVTGVNDAPVAADDVLAPEGPVSLPEERLITFEAQSNPPANVDGYAFAGFTVFGFAGVGGTSMAAASTGNDNVGSGFDADGAVQRVDGGDFALHSLSIASMSFEPTVTIVGYNDGTPVQGAEVSRVLEGGYATIDFGAAWGNVDEVRFYGVVAESEGDYLMIDNLQVSSGGSGPSGHSEDVPLDIDVLANDTDVDASDVLQVSSFSAISAMGAAISLNPDGTLRYDPTDADDIQLLANGETATDTFEYTASDGNGGTSVATVSISLLGVDEPDASLGGALSAPDVDLV
jgi:VCBS repeat-containing protein